MVTTTSPLDALAPAQDLTVPGDPPLALRVWGRKPRGATLPLVLHFHGGAFTSGDLDSGESLAQLLAGSGAVVASLAYPLAPAHRFPDAVEFKVFRAMTCYNLGRSKEGMETLLGILATTTTDPALLPYRRAMALYAEDLDRRW